MNLDVNMSPQTSKYKQTETNSITMRLTQCQHLCEMQQKKSRRQLKGPGTEEPRWNAQWATVGTAAETGIGPAHEKAGWIHENLRVRPKGGVAE